MGALGFESGLGFKTHRVLLDNEGVQGGGRSWAFEKPGGWAVVHIFLDPVGEESTPPQPLSLQKRGKGLRLALQSGYCACLRWRRVGGHCCASLWVSREQICLMFLPGAQLALQ